MSKKKEISATEMNEISEKTGVDPDILKSWYKGTYILILFLKIILLNFC